MDQGMQSGTSGLDRHHIRPIPLAPPRIGRQRHFAAARGFIAVKPQPIQPGTPHVQLGHAREQRRPFRLGPQAREPRVICRGQTTAPHAQ